MFYEQGGVGLTRLHALPCVVEATPKEGNVIIYVEHVLWDYLMNESCHKYE